MTQKNEPLQNQNSLSRRDFLKRSGYTLAGGATAISFAGCEFLQQASVNKPKDDRLIFANLVHLGYNMWADRKVDDWGGKKKYKEHIVKNVAAHDYLRCDQKLWDDIAKKMSEAGMNMMVIDLGEGVKYKSHPELGVRGAWNTKRLKKELAKLRALGIEPIPKLNFSTSHDTWLGEYSRCVSTPTYYKVCGELIAEVCELFDKPRFFHLGYDEESARHQGRYAYVVVRQHEQWWHDFYFFVEQVEKNGVRPWIWSDYVWNHAEEFYKKMPKSVLQSNWYYGTDFSKFEAGAFDKSNTTRARIQSYIDLDKQGYDQIPTASNWGAAENFAQTVEFCKKHLSSEHLKGFLQTPWTTTLEPFRDHHIEAIKVVGDVIAKT